MQAGHLKVSRSILIYSMSQKKRAPKITDKYGVISKKDFKQSSFIYIFNCHIVFLSSAKKKKKKQEWFS